MSSGPSNEVVKSGSASVPEALNSTVLREARGWCQDGGIPQRPSAGPVRSRKGAGPHWVREMTGRYGH